MHRIGTIFTVDPNDVTDQINTERLAELRDLTTSLGSRNIVRLHDLRSYIGKASSLASLLYTCNPFVHMRYAAVYCPQAGAPFNCRWRSYIEIPLRWISAFLKAESSHLKRRFPVVWVPFLRSTAGSRRFSRAASPTLIGRC